MLAGKLSGVIQLNVLNKHAAILKILQCAGCNIKNIAVCRLQLFLTLQPAQIWSAQKLIAYNIVNSTFCV